MSTKTLSVIFLTVLAVLATNTSTVVAQGESAINGKGQKVVILAIAVTALVGHS